jgi:integrase/recombinase XerD
MNPFDNSPQIVLVNSEENLINLVRQFILSLDLRSNSKQTYERGLKRFVSWFIDMQIINPTREDILAYKDYLEGDLLSPLTISGYMVIVRRFFEYLEGVKVYPNVARGVKGMKRSIGFRKDPLTLKQIQTLFHGLERETITGKRDFAIINLLVRTGLRTIEIIRSNMGDIRQESGEEVLWIQGKGRDTKENLFYSPKVL